VGRKGIRDSHQTFHGLREGRRQTTGWFLQNIAVCSDREHGAGRGVRCYRWYKIERQGSKIFRFAVVVHFHLICPRTTGPQLECCDDNISSLILKTFFWGKATEGEQPTWIFVLNQSEDILQPQGERGSRLSRQGEVQKERRKAQRGVTVRGTHTMRLGDHNWPHGEP
jgi:hypothetical protein